MNKSDRQEALERVLTKVFKPKFDAILEEVESALRGYLNKERPEFVRLMAIPNCARYLATSTVYRVYLNQFRMCRPIYGHYAVLPDNPSWFNSKYNCHPIEPVNILCPRDMDKFEFVDDTLFKFYKTLWSEYSQAWERLSALFNSYKTRAKLIADFPEYAEFIPEPVGKKQLPQVIVSEVRAELTQLGVP